MPEDKIYSLDNIIELTGGDSVFISEMIHMYISQAETFHDDASIALKNNDFGLLKQKAHKFKTSAQLFQIIQLHSLLVDLEGYNDFSEKEVVLTIIKEVERLSDVSVKQLKEELNNY